MGEVSETVEITSIAGETVNTTSGEVARVIDQQQVQNLALNGRNYIQLLSLVPGVALLNDDQLELTTSLAAGNQSINGNRGQTNNVTVDGGFNLQSGSNMTRSTTSASITFRKSKYKRLISRLSTAATPAGRSAS